VTASHHISYFYVLFEYEYEERIKAQGVLQFTSIFALIRSFDGSELPALMSGRCTTEGGESIKAYETGYPIGALTTPAVLSCAPRLV
jgi:hypothetical protein